MIERDGKTYAHRENLLRELRQIAPEMLANDGGIVRKMACLVETSV